MRIALDTNRYTDLMAGAPGVLHVAESATEILVPFVVLAELRAGFANGNRPNVNEKILETFLHRPSIKAIYADKQTVAIYASLSVDLRRLGKKIPHNDLWIAALCVQHDAALYTRDRHFDHLPQLMRV